MADDLAKNTQCSVASNRGRTMPSRVFRPYLAMRTLGVANATQFRYAELTMAEP